VKCGAVSRFRRGAAGARLSTGSTRLRTRTPLAQFAPQSNRAPWREIAAFDEPLLARGNAVSDARARLAAELQEPVSAAQRRSAEPRSGAAGVRPGRGEDFAAELEAARAEDARLRQTSVGPHRDDVHFFVNEQSSDYGSEGQHRTLVLALRLGAARLLEAHFETPPLLLLDDIFGELDLTRRNALLQALPAQAQKLITTTHLDWMPADDASHILRLG
jgi:DNA replication and repair protein RecF